jgi:hypothetical protein
MNARVIIISIISVLLAPGAGDAAADSCIADRKLHCTAGVCLDIAPSLFAAQERFYLDRRTGEFSACLWTRCYSGKYFPLARQPAGMEVFTVLAADEREEHQDENVTVAMTIDGQGFFSAVTLYDRTEHFIYHGQCRDQEAEDDH